MTRWEATRSRAIDGTPDSARPAGPDAVLAKAKDSVQSLTQLTAGRQHSNHDSCRPASAPKGWSNGHE
jgi:hypothetical protein